MGGRRCCCNLGCWSFTDRFNRPASSDLGGDWYEATGNWEIIDAGAGDLCTAGCSMPLCQLHEAFGTAIGAGGVSGSAVIGTKPVPTRSAGCMHIQVMVFDPQVSDTFYLYPCCPSSTSIGSAPVCSYTYLGSNLWYITIDGEDKGISTTLASVFVPLAGHVAFGLWVCADHEHRQIRASVESVGKPPIWVDCTDPGDGCYYALGHANSTHGAVFDDFLVAELRDSPSHSCVDCWCWCQGNPIRRNLHCEIIDVASVAGAERATCLLGVNWDMIWNGSFAMDLWYGSCDMPLYGSGTRTVNWKIACGGTETTGWPGKNITLQCLDGCAPFLGTYTTVAARSSCNPLILEYGPMHMDSSDFACEICRPSSDFAMICSGTPTDVRCQGYFYVRVTEAVC